MSLEEDYLEYERERARLENDEDSLDAISPDDHKDSPKLQESTAAADPKLMLAVVVGHSKRSPGFFGEPPITVNEYEWNIALAEKIVDQARSEQISCRVFFRDGIGIDGAYKAAEAWGAKASVELHFNVYNRKFRGSETLYGNRSPQSETYARHTHSRIVAALGTTDRGLRLQTGDARGAHSVRCLAVPSIVVEPFFGDNPEDAAIGNGKTDALASAIIGGFIALAKGTG